jgi:hypothetical protein
VYEFHSPQRVLNGECVFVVNASLFDPIELVTIAMVKKNNERSFCHNESELDSHARLESCEYA